MAFYHSMIFSQLLSNTKSDLEIIKIEEEKAREIVKGVEAKKRKILLKVN